jgi:hypothetical protein
MLEKRKQERMKVCTNISIIISSLPFLALGLMKPVNNTVTYTATECRWSLDWYLIYFTLLPTNCHHTLQTTIMHKLVSMVTSLLPLLSSGFLATNCGHSPSSGFPSCPHTSATATPNWLTNYITGTSTAFTEWTPCFNFWLSSLD